jgi:hypothetical protein
VAGAINNPETIQEQDCKISGVSALQKQQWWWRVYPYNRSVGNYEPEASTDRRCMIHCHYEGYLPAYYVKLRRLPAERAAHLGLSTYLIRTLLMEEEPKRRKWHVLLHIMIWSRGFPQCIQIQMQICLIHCQDGAWGAGWNIGTTQHMTWLHPQINITTLISVKSHGFSLSCDNFILYYTASSVKILGGCSKSPPVSDTNIWSSASKSSLFLYTIQSLFSLVLFLPSF